jgi:predicted GIY-YIG superfamily endonuclease/uncharacterized protein YegL
MWQVYLLRCCDNSIYTGITNNLERRLKQHNGLLSGGAKYTRGRRPVVLLKAFSCATKSQALKLEHQIKKLSKIEKLNFQLDISKSNISTKDIIMKDNFVAIAAILDASGSMHGLTCDTIGSFNQFLQEQKAVPGEVAFTLCTFNTDYRLVHDFQPLANVSELTLETYRAEGGTALLDAMGTTIDALGVRLAALPEHERPSKVIVLVITDGEENSSHRYTREQIQAKVQHQQDVYSWSFVFIGANIDAISAGTSMGFTTANSVNYVASAGGTRSLYNSISSNMTSYRSAAVRGAAPVAKFFTDPIADVDNQPALGLPDLDVLKVADLIVSSAGNVPVISSPPTHNKKPFKPGKSFPTIKK